MSRYANITTNFLTVRAAWLHPALREQPDTSRRTRGHQVQYPPKQKNTETDNGSTTEQENKTDSCQPD